MNQSTILSPKAFAEAIGVSESSVKRWADAGLIEVTRTAGGHRRILLSDAVRFVRSQQMKLVKPERIGLSLLGNLEAASTPGDVTASDLIEAVQNGRSENVVSLLVSAYVRGSSMADLWDEPIAGALEHFGGAWEQDRSNIPLEHEMTMSIVDAVIHIKSLMPIPDPNALTALGGSPSGDPYLLPNIAASTVLTECGLRAINLGPDTPVDSFMDAVQRHKPVLVWISATSPRTDKESVQIDMLVDQISTSVREVVLGGRFALSQRQRWSDNARVLRTMNELALLADTLDR